jgi:hypothetical protein
MFRAWETVVRLLITIRRNTEKINTACRGGGERISRVHLKLEESEAPIPRTHLAAAALAGWKAMD